MNGKVYIVGAGCGSYDLITLRGMKILEKCSVVVYDSLIDKRLLSFAGVGAEKICVGKRAGIHSETQERINEILITKAKSGKTVCRLKGGDPFVFGRGGEEAAELERNSVPYEIVPGISSSIAVPELAGIPVTHRKISRSFHVITGHTAGDSLLENIRQYAQLEGTLIFLMGLKNLGRIANELIAGGKPGNTPATVISEGDSPCQITVRGTLENIYDKVIGSEIKAPAVIVVGDTAGFDLASGFMKKAVSVTAAGTRRFTEKLSRILDEAGMETERLDCLRIKEYGDNSPFDDALMNVCRYRWIVLTSINGAEIFFKRLKKLNIDIRTLVRIKFAVIGSGTAEAMEKHGVFPELVPEKYTSVALGAELLSAVKKDERVLLLRAEQGSRALTDMLCRNNIAYDDIKIYDAASCEAFHEKKISTDFIVFSSGCGVMAFFEQGFYTAENTKVVCIGNVTACVLEKYYRGKYLVAETQNVQGIRDVILREVYKNEKIQTAEGK